MARLILVLLLIPAICFAGPTARRFQAIAYGLPWLPVDGFSSLAGWATDGWGWQASGRVGTDGSAYATGLYTMSTTVTATAVGGVRFWYRRGSSGIGDSIEWRVNGGEWSALSADSSWRVSPAKPLAIGSNIVEIRTLATTSAGVYVVDDLEAR